MIQAPARIQAPAPELFVERYAAASRPVVLTGMLAGQPIDSLSSLEVATGALGDMLLDVRKPYHSDGFAGLTTEPEVRHLTLADYFAQVRTTTSADWICVEQPTPSAVHQLLTEPGYCRIAGDRGDTWQSRLFVGNAGSTSNLHFDGDFRAVLLHQVFGVKRLVLVAPAQAVKLLPFMNLSHYRLARFTANDRAAFLHFTGAYETLLRPGETAFIPAGWWHHIDYVKDSLSVNFRLCRNRLLRFIGDRGFHKTWRLSCVAASAPHPNRLSDDDERLLERFRQALVGGTPTERLRRVEALTAEACRQRYPGLPEREYADVGGGVTESAMWDQLLRDGVLYAE